MEKVKWNKKFSSTQIPRVSVITSVYNRREVLLRAMRSVEAQTFRDIEYIVVNNGSSINIDDVVEEFMEEATIPVVYIKREHGLGPHTGKNSAIKAARGKYLVMLDSDDELLPNAVEVLYNAWMAIPETERDEYREVVARCVDEHGNVIGKPFPEYVNSLSMEDTYKFWQQPEFALERAVMDRTDYVRECPFPEPEGVTWVVDGTILWERLSKLYKSKFINDCLKRYYVGSEDSITNTQVNKFSVQHVINLLYAQKFKLDHYDEYFHDWKTCINDILRYNVYCQMLKMSGNWPDFDWANEPLQDKKNKALSAALWSPTMPIAMYYKKKRLTTK